MTSTDNALPLMIEPASPGGDLADWVGKNKEQFEFDLLQHGGILYRGFGIDTAEKFNHFMKCFDTTPLPYMFRSSPRTEIDKSIKNIYFSTLYPSERSINMHNESSYSRIWGRKIFFCCLQPAAEGGETPLCDSRKVLQNIDPALVKKFREKGVKYRRNLMPDLGMSWQEVFQTDDMHVLENTCKQYDIKYIVAGKDHIILEWVKPAVYVHPVSHAQTWFNHVLFFHKYSRYEELGLTVDDDLPSEYLTSETFFGDGSEISAEEYLDIKNAYTKNIVAFPYEKGDVVVLDNMLAAHGRYPYKGDRTIITAIIEATYDDAIKNKK